jgi:hypothetical protein
MGEKPLFARLSEDTAKKIKKISKKGFTNHRTCAIIYLADEATGHKSMGH